MSTEIGLIFFFFAVIIRRNQACVLSVSIKQLTKFLKNKLLFFNTSSTYWNSNTVFTHITVMHKHMFRTSKILSYYYLSLRKAGIGGRETHPVCRTCWISAVWQVGYWVAIAKAGAAISRIPLYLHIALLRHEQVHVAFVIWFILSRLS